jgi:hypothetical protein
MDAYLYTKDRKAWICMVGISDADRRKIEAHSGKHESIQHDVVDGRDVISADGVVIWEGK